MKSLPDEMAVEQSGFAKIVSDWIDPRYLVGPVVFVAALRGSDSLIEAVGWTLIVLVTAIVPLIGFISLQTKRGVFVDNQVPDQYRRNQVYLVGNVGLLVGLLILMLLPAPKSLVALLVAMLVSGTIASGINLRWKVSIHTGAVAGTAVSLLALLGSVALPALALIPLIGRSRVALNRHTLSQVITGGIIGGGITMLVFWVMWPLS